MGDSLDQYMVELYVNGKKIDKELKFIIDNLVFLKMTGYLYLNPKEDERFIHRQPNK